MRNAIALIARWLAVVNLWFVILSDAASTLAEDKYPLPGSLPFWADASLAAMWVLSAGLVVWLGGRELEKLLK